MRTHVFFDNVDASIEQVSDVFTVDCGQNMSYLLTVSAQSLNSNPLIYVQQSYTPNGYTDLWLPVSCCSEPLTISNTTGDEGQGFQDDEFMGVNLRLKLVPNGNTSGTLTAYMGYKTMTS